MLLLKLNNKIITGISFILLGGLSFLGNTGYLKIGTEETYGLVLIFFGLPSVYIAMSSGRRGRLFFSAALFFVGIIFLVKDKFDLLDTRGIVFTAVLFIGGAVLFLLFIDNPKEKTFLIAGIILMGLGYLSAVTFRDIGVFAITNKAANIANDFWPVILIIFGITVFLNRKK